MICTSHSSESFGCGGRSESVCGSLSHVRVAVCFTIRTGLEMRWLVSGGISIGGVLSVGRTVISILGSNCVCDLAPGGSYKTVVSISVCLMAHLLGWVRDEVS